MDELVATSTATLGDLASQAISAGQGGAWGLAIGAGIMLLIRIASGLNLLKFLPASSKKWVALGISVAGAAAAGLLTGAGVLEILTAAGTAAASAVGSWEFAKALPILKEKK